MRSITRAHSRADQKTLRNVVLALVLALSSTCVAAVRALTWGSVEADSRWQVPMVFVDFNRSWFLPPEAAAAEMRKRPAGSRVLMLRFFVDDIARHPKDACMVPDGKGGWQRSSMPSPWMVNGIRECRARVQTYFEAFKRAGGQVDYVLYDAEESLSCWYLNKANMQAICADPRFRSSVALASGDSKGVFNLSRILGVDVRKVDYINDSWARWNAVMSTMFDYAINEAGYKPVRALYPNVIVSNYETGTVRQADAIPNGLGELKWSPSSGVGTHDSWQFYGSSADWQPSTLVDGRNTIGQGAYAQLRLGVIGIRSLLQGSTRPQMPWIAHRQFGRTRLWGEWTVPFAGTAYWDEQVRQLAMHGCETLLMFNPDQKQMPGDPLEYNPIEDVRHFEGLLGEINDRLATATGPAIWYQKGDWSDRILATGRTVRGGTLWRFSFAENVRGVTVLMRNGEVQTIVPEQGEAGAWFFAASANPITERADRTGLAVAELDETAVRADVDGSGTIDMGDQSLILMSMGETGDSAEDIDRDGVVTQADASAVTGVIDQAKSARTVRMPVIRTIRDTGSAGSALAFARR